MSAERKMAYLKGMEERSSSLTDFDEIITDSVIEEFIERGEAPNDANIARAANEVYGRIWRSSMFSYAKMLRILDGAIDEHRDFIIGAIQACDEIQKRRGNKSPGKIADYSSGDPFWLFIFEVMAGTLAACEDIWPGLTVPTDIVGHAHALIRARVGRSGPLRPERDDDDDEISFLEREWEETLAFKGLYAFILSEDSAKHANSKRVSK